MHTTTLQGCGDDGVVLCTDHLHHVIGNEYCISLLPSYEIAGMGDDEHMLIDDMEHSTIHLEVSSCCCVYQQQYEHMSIHDTVCSTARSMCRPASCSSTV